MFNKTTVALLAPLVLATAAHAVVTFNTETGTGWVGKGDVQLAYGWNDKTMQNNANSVDFQVTQQVTYTVSCTITKITGPTTSTYPVTNTRVRNLIDVQDGDPRIKNSRFTGYFLRGYTGAATASGDPTPVLGGTCTAQGETGTITAISSAPGQTKLFAVYSGDKRLLGQY